MSVVDIGYATRHRAVSGSVFAPVGAALKDFVGTVSDGLAGVISLIAFMLPWFLFVILPGLWTLLWFRRRVFRKKP
jgi:hypothetical protein